MNDMKERLAQHPFLKDLKTTYLELLAECAATAQFKKGGHVFRQGENADRLYLIEEGKVGIRLEMPSHDPITIMTLGAGGVAGWSCLFPPSQWQFAGWGMEDTAFITLDATCVLAKCKADYELGYELMRRCSQIMADRLMATRLQLLDVLG